MRALVTAFAALALTAPAMAQTVTVPANHTGLVRLPQDAATIVVGNPAIADAMLQGPRTLFVSGRVYGQTNLIALNADGQVIMATDIAVTLSDRDHVQVVRAGGEGTPRQYTYVCQPVCQAVLSVGDENQSYFAPINEQRNAVTGSAQDAASGGGDASE
jgi:hypothetical protein